MRWLKWFAIGSAGLAAIIATAIVAVLVLVDTAALKTTLATFMADKYQRTLVVAGDLRLSFWPRLGVSVQQASLSEPRSTATALKVAQATLSVDVMPLLRGQVRVGAVTLDGLAANWTRDRNGKTNFDDLLGGTKTEADPVQFDIEKMTLRNAALTVRDMPSGLDAVFTQLNVMTGRIAQNERIPFDVRMQIQSKRPILQGEFQGKGVILFDSTAQRVDFSKLDVGYRGLFDHQAVRGSVSAKTLGVALQEGRYVAEDLKVQAESKQGSQAQALTLNVPQLNLTPDSAQAKTLRATLTLTGTQNLNADVVADGVSGNTSALKIAQLSVKAKGTQGQKSFQADLKSPINADVKMGTIRVSPLTGRVQVDDPVMPAKTVQLPLSADVQADLKEQKARARVETQFDQSTIAATFDIQHFSAPRIRFDINVNQLNVDRYFPPAAQKTAASEQPINLQGLKSLNAVGTLRIGQLQMKQMKASQVVATLNTVNGDMRIAPLSAQLYDGRLDATAQVNAHQNRYAFNGRLTQVQLGPLLRDVAQNDMVEGRGTVHANVTAQGLTVTALKKALNGTATVRIEDGAIKGYDLGKTLGNAREKLNVLLKGGAATNERGGGSTQEKTRFSELTSSFNIVNGMAHNDDLNVKAPLFRLGGSGKIDIGESRVDYIARASVVNTLTGQGGKDKTQTKDLTIPVRITGPFDRLGWEVQWAAVGSEALKASVGSKVEEKKQEVKEKAREQIKDKLRGLLNR